MTAPARHAIVVGGTTGSGEAVVRRLLEDGYLVSVFGRREQQAVGESVRPCVVDVTDRSQLIDALHQAIAEAGAVEALVLVQRFRGEGDSWEGELAVSLTATKDAIETLRGSFAAAASIVLVTSHASRLVAVEQPAGYHAAKAALRQLARYYAVVLGPEGVRVNCVTPGTVAKPGRDVDERVRELDARITPLGRMGTPSDVADIVSLLCDERARFVTGQDIAVDGGLSLLWQETLARVVAGIDSA
jgi:NAD(P)-dependent dehydrogenase (short-subunit alcohol dehydrogenase family)